MVTIQDPVFKYENNRAIKPQQKWLKSKLLSFRKAPDPKNKKEKEYIISSVKSKESIIKPPLLLLTKWTGPASMFWISNENVMNHKKETTSMFLSFRKPADPRYD